MIAYADSGLRTDLGHHANNAREIVAGLRKAGQDVRVLGHAMVDPALRDELLVEPVFSRTPYEHHNPDPVAGWIHDFNVIGAATSAELAEAMGVTEVNHPPRLYWNSAQPPQLLAVLKLLNDRPHVRAVVEFGTAPGLDTSIGSDGVMKAAWRDPRADPTGTMWRYCSYLIGDAIRPRLTLAAYCRPAAELFAEVLGHPVACLPVPRSANPRPFLRGERPQLTVGILGHQRNGDKGWQLVPAIVRHVLEKAKLAVPNRSVRFLLHNGGPGGCGTGETDAMVRNLVREYPAQVEFCVDPAGPEVWQGLLDATDLMVCPYWPERFHASWSSAAAEAVGNGIPLVCPSHTTLQDFSGSCGAAAATFGEWTAKAVADATLTALANHAQMAEVCLAAVERWRARHGGDRTARAILGALGAGYKEHKVPASIAEED